MIKDLRQHIRGYAMPLRVATDIESSMDDNVYFLYYVYVCRDYREITVLAIAHECWSELFRVRLSQFSSNGKLVVRLRWIVIELIANN